MRPTMTTCSQESCETCKNRGIFRKLPASALKVLDQMQLHLHYPERSTLFEEKQQPRGAFMVCEGQVKLSVSSSEGKVLTLRVARPGEIIGLSESMLGTPYEYTAETLYTSRIAFIRREDLVRFLAQFPEAYRCIAEELTSQFHTACEQLRTIGLSPSVSNRLARLILDWTDGRPVKRAARVRLALTHEQIAELIGTSRETVTRTLTDFQDRNLVMRHGVMLTIPDVSKLQSVAAI